MSTSHIDWLKCAGALSCIDRALLCKSYLIVVVRGILRGYSCGHCLQGVVAQRADLSFAHSSRPRINPELLLVSGLVCTTWIVLCPLMFLVEFCDVISNKIFLIYERALMRKTVG